MNKKPDLSIVIGNYNTKNLLLKNLALLQKNLENVSYEIIVVDDASTDNSVSFIRKQFPKILLFENHTNQGYSKSYNLGTKKSRGRFILHLNSDTNLRTKTDFSKVLKFLDQNPKIGILGCKLVKENGRLDPPCKRSFPTPQNVFFQTIGLSFLFPQNRLFGKYYLSFLDENKIQPVDCLIGAFMLIRKEVFKDIGFIDERFFLYGEDIDFCKRAKDQGWEIFYYPKIIFHHVHGGTTRTNPIKAIWLFHQAMFIYYQKHNAPKKSFIFNIVIYLGILLRFLLLLLLLPFSRFFIS